MARRMDAGGEPGGAGRPRARGGADGRALYVISVAAELAGVHPQTLRIYERKGLLRPARTAGNTRRYSERDIEQLQMIQRLTQDAGVNLAGVKMIVELQGRLEEMRRRVEEMDRELQRTRRRVREEMERARKEAAEIVLARSVRPMRFAQPPPARREPVRRRVIAVGPASPSQSSTEERKDVSSRRWT